MDNIYSPSYRKDYLTGYYSAFNPYIRHQAEQHNEAYNTGFHLGRLEFEDMNGSLSEGIPLRILTRKNLEEFMLAGILGMPVEVQGYNPYQIEIINRWYQSGIEKYEPESAEYLREILEVRGIEMSHL